MEMQWFVSLGFHCSEVTLLLTPFTRRLSANTSPIPHAYGSDVTD